MLEPQWDHSRQQPIAEVLDDSYAGSVETSVSSEEAADRLDEEPDQDSEDK
jgi:hypothetical protein